MASVPLHAKKKQAKGETRRGALERLRGGVDRACNLVHVGLRQRGVRVNLGIGLEDATGAHGGIKSFGQISIPAQNTTIIMDGTSQTSF